MGIVVVSRGVQRSGPSLVVANHVSWLDVLVLAAAGPVLPVAKAEVAGWPLLGGLAARIGTVFVRRDRWRELPDTVEQMAGALRRGQRLQVFPEATTRCGSALNTFHRAAFQAAVDAAVVVSPVALRYCDRTERAGIAGRRRGAVSGGGGNDGGGQTAVAAFVGDDDLLASIWRVLRAGPLSVRVDWLPVIPALVDGGHPARNRARVALRAERAVASALGQPVVGRTTERQPVSTAQRPVTVLVPLALDPLVPGERRAVNGTTLVA